MKRSLLFIGALSLLIAGCATPQSQMKRELSEIIVKSDPEVLVVKGGKIEADVTMKFPQGYFGERTMLVMTPVLVYGQSQQRTGKPFIYQGEKIMANYKVVPVGGINHHESFSLAVKPGWQTDNADVRHT